MLPVLIPSVHTQEGVGDAGAPRQAGFQRVNGPSHALSHLAPGGGPGRGRSQKRTAPGRVTASVSVESLPLA